MTVATLATARHSPPACVAKVAGVTVAKFPQQHTALPAKVGSVDMATASRWWLIHYPNSDPVETIFDPPMTHAELLKWNRDAIAAEPLMISTPSLSAEAESAIRQWLVEIGEKDQTVIEGVLALSDVESHQWVLEQLEKMR